MMRTRPTIKLPPVPREIDNEDVRSYLRKLDMAVREFVKAVYEDLSNGRIQHRTYTTEPTTSDVEEGEIVFYKSNSTVKLYGNVAGTMYSVTLT